MRSGPPRTDHVLITGGAGFVGSNLAHRLAAEGRRVMVFDALCRPGTERNLAWLRSEHGDRIIPAVADVRDPAAIEAATAQASIVFHLAAQVAVTTSLDDPCDDFAVNAAGTLNVLEAVRRRADPPPVVHTSTNKVYGSLVGVRVAALGDRYVPRDARLAARGIAEQQPLEFASPYGCSKGAADQYVIDYARSYGLRTVVFRMSCVYGPRQFGTEDQGWVAHFLKRSLSGEPITIFGDGRQVRDVLYVGDLVEAFRRAEDAIGALAGAVFNIGGGPDNQTSLLELLDRLPALLGRRPVLRFAPWRIGDQRWYVSDTRGFAERTGWTPQVGVQDGLARLAHWLSADGQAVVGAPASHRVAS